MVLRPSAKAVGVNIDNGHERRDQVKFLVDNVGLLAREDAQVVVVGEANDTIVALVPNGIDYVQL